ncbi:MAG: putative photosynthetic complex assembly protein PuhE [Paracoccaceae bacterium]|jgi:putative photosynthetic complex assembly protein 2|nr:putative photosynthetic complex assembly protein PuhE [Paracoccaceae bacterium]MDP5349505.1 putative photosynthetic complex assembly protein PuhE [Paracoccaceae bacterium]
MLDNPWITGLVALFIWWFSTGVILVAVRYADRHGARACNLATWVALPLFALGLWGLHATSTDGSVAGAYLAFLSAIAVWGWIELAFLTGIITGPNAHTCPDELPEWERFIRAWGTIAYHEMLLVAVLILIMLYCWGAENTFGMWTFAVLFFARVSAKLNLFFGVPKINVEFLPSPLAHLPSHFRLSRLNWVFPFSVTALTFAAACWLERLMAVETAGDTVGFALLTAITSLALLEHWLMVVPLPDEKLWRWMLPAPKPAHPDTTPLKKT